MGQISAKQLIYTRVEEHYSPTNKSGYQVYYASPDLHQNIVTIIVNKISDFEPHTNGIKRWQCFFLENKSEVVISQTQIIDSHPEIIDRDRRPNILVAHCLILKLEDYKFLNCNPFRIFEQFKYVSSALYMIKNYNQLERKEAAAEFLPGNPIDYEADYLKGRDIYKLALTATPDFIKNNRTLLLFGEDNDIYNLLKAVFLSVPASYRINLSFDTYIRVRRPLPGEFWAVGSPEWKPGYTIAINAATQDFSSDPISYKDLYLLWLEANTKNDLSYKSLVAIQDVSDSFGLRKIPNEDIVTDLDLRSFYSLHREYIYTKILRVLVKLLGENVALRFLKFFEEKSPIYDFISIASAEYFHLQKLAKYIREWFLTSPTEPNNFTREDWKIVKEFSINTKDYVLIYWIAIFTGDKKMISQSAGVLSRDEYDYALKLLKRPLPPLSLYISKYSPEFINAVLEKNDELGEGEYISLVQEILNTNEAPALSNFYSFIFQLSNKELTNLEKITAKKRLPAEFQSAIIKRRSQLGQPHTIFDNILGRK